MAFALHYQHLVFFAHSLEILLHTIVEEDHVEHSSDSEGENVLERTVEFLDYFDVSLDVIVGCARKIEVTRWPRLFDVAGNPKSLFETCLATGRLKTAASYLLVLHALEQLDHSQGDAVRLLRAAMAAKEWQLCRDILRFLRSIDDSGAALRVAVTQAGILELDGEME